MRFPGSISYLALPVHTLLVSSGADSGGAFRRLESGHERFYTTTMP